MPESSGYLHVFGMSKAEEVFVLSPPGRRHTMRATSGGNPKKGVSFLVTTAREPRAYEIMAVFLPELADEDLTAQLDRTGGYISSVGGTIKEVLTDSPWGRRRLAYPIRFNSQDFRDGFYAVYHFDLEPSAMVDIERELKLDTRVMRYLVVHDDPKAGERNTGRPEAEAGAEDATVTSATAADAAPPTETTAVPPAAAPAEDTAAAAPVETPSDTAQAEPAPADEEAVPVAADTAVPDEAPAPHEVPDVTVVTAAPADGDDTSEQPGVPVEAVPATPGDDATDSEQGDES